MSEPDFSADPPPLSPAAMLRAAVRVVPALRYALGVGGLAGVVSVVTMGWRLEPQTAIVGGLFVLAFMVVLVVFAALAGLHPYAIRMPALVLAWSFLIIMVATASLFVSCAFFSRPKTLPCLLRNECQSSIPISTVRQTPSSVQSPPLSQSPAVTVPANLTATMPALSSSGVALSGDRSKPVRGGLRTIKVTDEDLQRIGQALRSSSLYTLDGASDESEAEQACRFLDQVAAEADELVRVWEEIVAGLSEGTLDAERRDAIARDYRPARPTNTIWVSRLRAFNEILPEVASKHIDPKWVGEFQDQLTHLLLTRDEGKEQLQTVIRDLNKTLDKRESAGVSIKGLIDSVSELRASAGRLHALAKAARVVQRKKRV